MVQLRDCKHGKSYATVPHFKTVSNPLTPRLIIYDKIFRQLLNLLIKFFGVTIQSKTIWQDFRVVQFIEEYRKRHFPGLYCLKKKAGKMAIFGPKPWVNPFGKM